MRSSDFECKVYNILTANDFLFEEEYTFPDLTTKKGIPLRFDFAVFNDDGELDFLIECQGRQHYKPVPVFGGAAGLRRQKYNDSRKRQYCLKNKINLVAIPYWDEDKVNLDYIMRASGSLY